MTWYEVTVETNVFGKINRETSMCKAKDVYHAANLAYEHYAKVYQATAFRVVNIKEAPKTGFSCPNVEEMK